MNIIFDLGGVVVTWEPDHSIALNETWATRELRICNRSLDALPAAPRLLVEHFRKK